MRRSAVLLSFVLLFCPGLAHGQYDEYGGDVPYVPTPYPIVEAMLKLGNIRPSDFVIDLGCGDGRIVVMAAEKFGARGIGYDLNPQRIAEAKENAKKAGVEDRVQFIEKNLFDADISKATLVTLYLLPDVNLRLRPKLLRELRTGARIVSHSFDMGDWKPDRKIEVNGKTLYYWEVTEQAKKQFGEPQARIELNGVWDSRLMGRGEAVAAEMILSVRGQSLLGYFSFPDRPLLEVRRGRVEGDALFFEVERPGDSGPGAVYRISARFTEERMEGEAVAVDGNGQTEWAWTAEKRH
ncbi:MAG: class I SAM-dependent methyltransferase [Bryobacteraceae bacterium]|nr:class I SAM-dependent methyltransferase [Bryobacteraceae bacterium]